MCTNVWQTRLCRLSSKEEWVDGQAKNVYGSKYGYYSVEVSPGLLCEGIAKALL